MADDAPKKKKSDREKLSRITVRTHMKDPPDPSKKDRLLDRIEKTRLFNLILDLRKRGYSLAEIPAEIHKELGIEISQTKVTKLIAKLYDRAIDQSRETLEMYRKRDLERYDAVIKAMWPRMEKGDTRAADIMLKTLERQAKLLGLDAPEKKQIDVSVQVNDRDLVTEAKRLGLSIPPSLEMAALEGEGPMSALPPIKPDYEMIPEEEEPGLFDGLEEAVEEEPREGLGLEEDEPGPSGSGDPEDTLGVPSDRRPPAEEGDALRLPVLPADPQ